MTRWGIFLTLAVVWSLPGDFVLAAPIVPGSFSTTWDTGGATSIEIGLGVCPTSVYWEEIGNDSNNGTSTVCVGSIQTITFPSSGQYRVDFSGSFTTIDMGSFSDIDRDKFRSVEQWGNSSWTNLEAAFQGAEELSIPASDAPDLSNITSLSGLFDGATNFNSPIGHWDVSNVTNMQNVFAFTSGFNQDLSNWDVSSVTNFVGMFRETTSFNQPLNSWNVSSAESMRWMFWNALAFSQPLDNWDVSNVTEFGGVSPYADQGMFAGASAFNQPLNDWDVSNALNMRGMFSGATFFNQPLNNWNVSNVTNMNDMFIGSALSVVNYTELLNSWSTLLLQSGVNFDTDSEYCSSAQAARDTLTITYSWVISDGGSTPCYTLSYTAGPNATLIGNSTQTVIGGVDGTSVEIVPDAGYTFTGWSDSSTDNPRMDTNITADLTVTASVEPLSSGSNGKATRVGDRLKNKLSDTATTTTAASTPFGQTKETIIDSIKKFVAYFKDNESQIATLPPEESKRVILLMRDIIVYLLTLLPGYEK